MCRGGYFHYAAGNGDCGCAISKGCYGRMTFASNWTIYYRHPPAELLVDSGTSLQYEVGRLESTCHVTVNLRERGLFPIGGDIEQCGLVTVSLAGEFCKGTVFQYKSSTGDCACSSDDCDLKWHHSNWDIFHVLNFQPASTSGQGNHRVLRTRLLQVFCLFFVWPQARAAIEL